jgi:proteasome lid subunit RPN8/RPN11
MTATVTCPRSVLEAVEDHVHADVTREVGGVLVGTMEERSAAVEAVLPALRAVGRTANVTFTHEVWDEILAVVDREHPGRRIVGWYHSHPGFGVFLSDYDQFIHRSFFPDPRMLALVVDPKGGQGGWFGWRDGRIEQVEAFRIRAAAAAPPARRRRPAPVLLSMLLAVVGFGAGYALTDRTPPGASPVAERLAASQARVRALEAQVDALRAAGRRPAAATAMVRYRVRRGDTLWRIAAFFYGDPAASARIVAANRGVEPERLEVGEVLRIPLD